MTDPILALVTFLKLDGGLDAVGVNNRIFGAELPVSESGNMPRKAVVIKPVGGGFIGLEYQRYGDSRVDVLCYGATPLDSWSVYLAAYEALKNLRSEVHSGTLLHWAKASSRGTTLRNPDTDWPVTVSSYQVLAAEVAA